MNDLMGDKINFDKWLSVQEKDIDYKIQSLDIRKQEDKHNFNFATESLAANVKDKEAQRKHNRIILRYILIAGLIVVFCIIWFLCYAISHNKDQIAEEIIKIILYVAAGGIGGYSFGKVKKDK